MWYFFPESAHFLFALVEGCSLMRLCSPQGADVGDGARAARRPQRVARHHHHRLLLAVAPLQLHRPPLRCRVDTVRFFAFVRRRSGSRISLDGTRDKPEAMSAV